MLGNGTKLPHAALAIRQCQTIEDFDACVALQREAFSLPDLELSPRRHLIVTQQAGGWTLGAFAGDRLIGFVHHLVARRDKEIIGYSHMMAVAQGWQNQGVGIQLKWAQRARALTEGVRFIKWTWDPMQARNAHFNLNRLGVVVRSYATNFYGTDYLPQAGYGTKPLGLDSDRLFAEWDLEAPYVEALVSGEATTRRSQPVMAIEIPAQWNILLGNNTAATRTEQLRLRTEFNEALEQGLVCAGFQRDTIRPRYLFYENV